MGFFYEKLFKCLIDAEQRMSGQTSDTFSSIDEWKQQEQATQKKEIQSEDQNVDERYKIYKEKKTLCMLSLIIGARRSEGGTGCQTELR